VEGSLRAAREAAIATAFDGGAVVPPIALVAVTTQLMLCPTSLSVTT
jgi:hypothetical protein